MTGTRIISKEDGFTLVELVVVMLLLGILAATDAGYSASMFYAITYALMAIGGFGMIILLSRAGIEADSLDDFKGLNERSPWFAFMMLILMFSMAGVPPTLGFWAKLAVLSAVVDINMTWLAIVAVAFSIIGLFYYLRVVKLMYFDDAVDQAPVSCGRDMQITLSTNSIAILCSALIPLIISYISSTSKGASPSEGSSRSISLGRAMSALPMTSIWPNGPRANALKLKVPMFDASDTESLTAPGMAPDAVFLPHSCFQPVRRA